MRDPEQPRNSVSSSTRESREDLLPNAAIATYISTGCGRGETQRIERSRVSYSLPCEEKKPENQILAVLGSKPNFEKIANLENFQNFDFLFLKNARI